MEIVRLVERKMSEERKRGETIVTKKCASSEEEKGGVKKSR